MARLREPDQLPAEARRLKDRIGEDSARRPTTQCEKCGGRHFHRHQRRPRWFLLVVEQVVWPMGCWLYRWRCAHCGATMTHLPALGVAFKRYLRPEIDARAKAYVETEPLSYRQVVKERGAAVVYDDPIAAAEAPDAEKEDEATRALAPSTVHRWLGSLAAQRQPWQPVVRLARQLCQGTHLGAFVISAAKYRSQARRQVLEACGLLLRVRTIIAGRNPTQLATLGSSP